MLKNEKGHMIISGLLGFTLAIILFKPVCKKNCVLYMSPEETEIINKNYNFEGLCYRNVIIPTECIHNLKQHT
jgi:hypothetical protein